MRAEIHSGYLLRSGPSSGYRFFDLDPPQVGKTPGFQNDVPVDRSRATGPAFDLVRRAAEGEGQLLITSLKSSITNAPQNVRCVFLIRAAIVKRVNFLRRLARPALIIFICERDCPLSVLSV